jgi:hypothetical protein
MIKGRQIPVCSDAAKKIRRALDEVRAVEEDLRRAGLWSEAEKVSRATAGLSSSACDLDFAARDAFCAARRGELPV